MALKSIRVFDQLHSSVHIRAALIDVFVLSTSLNTRVPWRGKFCCSIDKARDSDRQCLVAKKEAIHFISCQSVRVGFVDVAVFDVMEFRENTCLSTVVFNNTLAFQLQIHIYSSLSSSLQAVVCTLSFTSTQHSPPQGLSMYSE